MADTEALTFEKVWEMFQETKRRMEETDRQMKETDERMKETDRLMRETRWKIEQTGLQIGYLNNRFGELAEHLVAPSIKEKFRALNFFFDHISQNHKITDNGRSLAEIDLLLENGDVVVAVEVKSKPLQKDVDEHIRRMEILRQKADANNDMRKYQGAIAGAIMSDEVRTYIHKTGFYAIEQTGDTVKINIPEGFIARVW